MSISETGALDPQTLRGIPTDQLMARMLEYAAERRDSDLFVSIEQRGAWISVRHQGIVQHVCGVTQDEGAKLIGHLKAMAGMKYAQKQLAADGRWICILPSGRRLSLRINTMPTLWGEDMTVRLLDCGAGVARLAELGYAEQSLEMLRNLLNNPNGLLLVTGPTGAGKTTTLYACLHYLNDGHRKINTIEDPIENEIPGIHQSQVRADYDLGFPDLLRAVLRQAPDVIMIGEIRDAITAETAVRAANSGHLVLATLHARCAAGCIDTMFCYGANPRFLANCLLGAISQRLVRKLCNHCKRPYDPAKLPLGLDDLRPYMEAAGTDQIYSAKGCEHCYYDGYTGRTAVAEVLCNVPEIRRMTDERASIDEIQNKAKELGMHDLRAAGHLIVARGVTSPQEIMRILVSV